MEMENESSQWKEKVKRVSGARKWSQKRKCKSVMWIVEGRKGKAKTQCENYDWEKRKLNVEIEVEKEIVSGKRKEGREKGRLRIKS